MGIWPEHYPGKCPPDHAVSVSGNIYRFTNSTNPKRRDFSSYYELKPGCDWGNKACDVRGLSVYRTEEDCIAAAAAVPALKKKHIAKASLLPSCGVIAPTNSNCTKYHNTFWSFISAEMLASLFFPALLAGDANV